MTQFDITSPEGKKFRITAPEGATKEQALDYFKQNYREPSESENISASAPAPTPAPQPAQERPRMPTSIRGAMRRMQEPGFVPPAAQPIPSREELARQYADVARATGAELGQLITGPGELLPGAAGEASARGTEYLKGVAKKAAEKTPGAKEISTTAALLTPIPGISKYLGAAKDLPQLLRRSAGTGAALGAAAPTGSPELEEKVLPTLAGTALGLVPSIPSAIKGAQKTLIGTTQPEITNLAKKAEGLGFVLEPLQLRKDKPIPSPGFMESAKLKNENLATKLVTEQTGKSVENINPTFLNERIKELGKNYDNIFSRSFNIDSGLVRQLKEMQDFERAVNPSGVGPVKSTAENIINRWKEEVLKQKQQNIENRIKRIMKIQQRGGVEPIVRLRKDWPTIRNASSSDAPEWAANVEKTVKELSEKLGLQVTPQVWVSSPRREHLYGMATGDGHIVINDKLDSNGAIATALHEFGHQAEFQMFINAPRDQRQAVIKAFDEQMASIPLGKKTVAQYRPITAEKYGEAAKKEIPDVNFEKNYLRNFSEWFAEMTSRFITQTKQPTNLVEKFFSKVADSWKAIYQKVTGYVPLPEEVNNFFKSAWKGELIEDAAKEVGVTTRLEAEGMIPESDVIAKIDGKELQRLRENLSRIARTASDGRDRRVAGDFVDVIDNSIGKYDKEILNKLQDTNKKYAATSTLAEGIEKGFVDAGKVNLSKMGDYLAGKIYGFGSGTTRHPLYDLGYLGRELGIVSRKRGADFERLDAVAALLGRSRQALGSLLMTRAPWARDIQRKLSEEELSRVKP